MDRDGNEFHRCCIVVTVVAVTVLSLPFGAALVDAANNYCTWDMHFSNNQRRVPGSVNLECTGLHDDDGWGNWGINSNTGSRRNGFQFPGWYSKGGWKQWQSCTREHPRPDRRYYNDAASGYRKQKADPDDSRHYASARFRSPRGTCRATAPGVHTYLGVYMDVYELDGGGIFWGRDDKVTKLTYGNVNIPISCTSSWSCSGQSSWLTPTSGNAHVTANVRVGIRMYRR